MTTNVKNSPIITLRGKTAAKRMAAFAAIAPVSLLAEQSRDELVSTIKTALGPRPSVSAVDAAKQEVKIGRIAQRLPAGELPKDCRTDGQRLEFARDLLLRYAAPPKEGSKPRKLRKGQVGRRTVMQHRVVRASDEAWSQLAAELGIGKAQTQSQRNKAKRAPQMAGSTQRGKFKVPAPIAKSDLPEAKLMDASTFSLFFTSTSATMEAFAKKYAGVCPSTHNRLVELVAAFRKEALSAANALQERKAKDDANAAEREDA